MGPALSHLGVPDPGSIGLRRRDCKKLLPPLDISLSFGLVICNILTKIRQYV
jgi:hypothetical protein